MIKKILPLICFFALFIVLTKSAFASGFNLNSIGALDVSGKQSSHWWYVGRQPNLVGEAAAGSTVSVSVDGVASSAVADSEGLWTYKHESTLENGDHEIVLENDGSTIKFTLTLGSANFTQKVLGEEITNETTLPATGGNLMTMLLIILGSGSVVAGIMVHAKNR
ncbi:MAG: hypothetical protein WCG91_00545 [Candidatus Shapirobacteria bacterium]